MQNVTLPNFIIGLLALLTIVALGLAILAVRTVTNVNLAVRRLHAATDLLLSSEHVQDSIAEARAQEREAWARTRDAEAHLDVAERPRNGNRHSGNGSGPERSAPPASSRSSAAAVESEVTTDEMIRKVCMLESQRPFLSMHWLDQTVFRSKPGMRSALKRGVSEGMLEVYESPNPNNPDRPTRCCRLNRNHPRVIAALDSVHGPVAVTA